MNSARKTQNCTMWTTLALVCAAALGTPSPSAHADDDYALTLEQPGGGFAIDGQYAEVEVVSERYPNRQVKVEREVTLDTEGNYVNHGTWKMWSANGDPVASGQYSLGQRNGVWSRWLTTKDAPSLRERPFNNFQQPFVAQAIYVDDQIDGDWTIYDAKKRKCCQISLKKGTRHGPAIHWLPNGKVYREEVFDNGLTVGDVLQMDNRGELKTTATFVAGRQITTQVTYFKGTRKKQTEATFLAPTKIVSEADDFWNCTFAEFDHVGEPLRHGSWKTWYSDGQLKLEGGYRRDREVGTFTWWYPNGQKAVMGEYFDGVQQGEWVWWHDNGQKETVGGFAQGEKDGLWRQWGTDGQLAGQVVHQAASPHQVVMSNESEMPVLDDEPDSFDADAESGTEIETKVEVAQKPEFPPLPWMR